jgi:hypothetical protein
MPRALRALTRHCSSRSRARWKRRQCRKKYDLTFDGAYSADTWKAITAENLAEADLRKRTKTARARGERVPHAPPARGQGAALGLEAVAELLDGARRLQRGERKDWAEVPLGSADVPRICVLAPKGYGVSVHSLFDTLPSSLFVVESPCSAPTADAVEGVLYGLNELRCNALVIFGSMQSAELDTYGAAARVRARTRRGDAVRPSAARAHPPFRLPPLCNLLLCPLSPRAHRVMAVAKAKATGALHALSPAERVWAEPMSEVALSLLQTAPPALSEGGLRVACMEGWLHSIDQRFSTVLEASVALVRHRELHIACVMADHGNVRLV